MNQSYFDNGDSVIVADEKGKMTVRDNHENITEELQLENFSEYCDKYTSKLQKKIVNLEEERESKLKLIKAPIISGLASFAVLPILFASVGLSSLLPVAFGTGSIVAILVGGGMTLSLLSAVPSKKKIAFLERKLKFSQDMFLELEKEAKMKQEDKKYTSQEKVVSQSSKGEIREVLPLQQSEDVNVVFDFIHHTTMANSMLHDMATSGSLSEVLYTRGYTIKQADLLTRYYSNVVVSESTINKKFNK